MSDRVITSQVRESIDRAVLCWLATAGVGGVPSVSPKEVFTHEGDAVLIANIASPGSARNIRENPAVCVAVLDIFRQKGFQLDGRAEVVTSGEGAFERLAGPLRQIAGEAFPFKSLFCVEVTSVRPVVAPRYRLFPETTEEDQVRDAMRSYGVRPGAGLG